MEIEPNNKMGKSDNACVLWLGDGHTTNNIVAHTANMWCVFTENGQCADVRSRTHTHIISCSNGLVLVHARQIHSFSNAFNAYIYL